jgi:hypothetical protein
LNRCGGVVEKSMGGSMWRVIAAAVVLVCGSAARADTVLIANGGATLGPQDATEPMPLYFMASFLGAPGPTLFEGRTYGPANVGSVFTATSATDADFDAFVSRLTDGFLGWFVFGATDNWAAGMSEPLEIWGDEADPRVDLHGYTITSISFRLDRFGPSGETGQNVEVVGSFYADTLEPVVGVGVPGTVVPVPAAAWGGLALLGGMGAWRMARLRRTTAALV